MQSATAGRTAPLLGVQAGFRYRKVMQFDARNLGFDAFSAV